MSKLQIIESPITLNAPNLCAFKDIVQSAKKPTHHTKLFSFENTKKNSQLHNDFINDVDKQLTNQQISAQQDFNEKSNTIINKNDCLNINDFCISNIETKFFNLHCDASTTEPHSKIQQHSNPALMAKEHVVALSPTKELIHSPTFSNSVVAGIIKFELQDLVCYKKNIVCYDNNIAELFAIHEGLVLAQHLGITNLNIYTDSAVSITFIKKHVQEHKEYKNNTKFFPITEHIFKTLENFDVCHFHHVPRKSNKQADKLTKFRK
jgi:ribonuclease HI